MSESVQNIERISVFPNPVNQQLYISADIGRVGKVEVFDPMGNRVWFGSSDKKEMQLDVSQFANGIYYISIGNDKKIVHRSFIKK